MQANCKPRIVPKTRNYIRRYIELVPNPHKYILFGLSYNYTLNVCLALEAHNHTSFIMVCYFQLIEYLFRRTHIHTHTCVLQTTTHATLTHASSCKVCANSIKLQQRELRREEEANIVGFLKSTASAKTIEETYRLYIDSPDISNVSANIKHVCGIDFRFFLLVVAVFVWCLLVCVAWRNAMRDNIEIFFCQ